ncbi:MAG: hypothetical protein ACRDOH_34575, partial [Streptosporangiaceae bacterium]
GTFGRVGDLYQYDIVSAYPAEIANLPCLRHGSWHETTTYDPHVVGIWKVSYAGGPVLLKGIGLPALPNADAIPPFTTWGPLPNRDVEGAITFPMKGIGWYWDVEVRAAISYMTSIGMKYEITSGWVFVPECDEKPFSNMPDAFAARKRYKETGDPAQLVLKLGINSVYGKTAQTVGAGAYACFEWAGMITAGCRAKILDAVCQDPSSIVAIATDAVYSTVPLDLPISDRLGDWSQELDKDVIMYKPGIWWGPAASKTRGFQRNNEMWEKAQAAWDQDGMAGTVAVEVKRFFGVGTCVAWNRPDLMGTWGTLTQTTTMGDPKKRQYGLDKFLWGMLPEVGVVHTLPHHSNKARPAPKEPYVLVESQPYRKLVDLDNDAYLELALTLDNEEHIKGGGE